MVAKKPVGVGGYCEFTRGKLSEEGTFLGLTARAIGQ
jgi:hypothetical protein